MSATRQTPLSLNESPVSFKTALKRRKSKNWVFWALVVPIRTNDQDRIACSWIAALIHQMEYVEKRAPLSGLKRCKACIKPTQPSWTRSALPNPGPP